jgi:predicted 3-demethylubiquinone-9 3-methyltransferase (glyoxalase superfamily)
MQFNGPRILPCLWFDGNGEEAARFYVSVFPDSRIVSIAHYVDAGSEVHGQPSGSVATVEFELAGQRFLALNGGPQFRFDEAVSFQILCDDQAEVDFYWDKLTDGGQEVACGWLKDRFGLSWQVVPKVLPEMLLDPDKAKVGRVFEAFMKMTKYDIAELERAYAG